MRYFYSLLTGSKKPPKPSRRLAASSAACLIVAFMVLTTGGAGAQQPSAVDTAAATRHLFEAVHGNNLAAVQSSLAAGADLSVTDEWGVTAIDLAADKGYFSIVHFLLSVRNLRQLEEETKPPPIPPAASATAEPQPVSPTPKPWAAVEESPKVSRQTAPAETQAPAPAYVPPATTATQSRPDGKPNPFDPSTTFPAGDLPIIGKIRRQPGIPEATAPSPPPTSKGFRPPTVSRAQPAQEASAPEGPVPGASEAVKPSALSRFTDTVSGFFLGKEKTDKTAPVTAPETAPEVASEEGPNDIPAPATPTTAEGEDSSRPGPTSATPEVPAPRAVTEQSAPVQKNILDYEESAPIDEEPQEDFLLASIFERISGLSTTKEKETTDSPSQSATDFESAHSESEAEPPPQATSESAGDTVEQQAKEPQAPVETATFSAPEPAAPETPAPRASTEDSAAAQGNILDYEESTPIDEKSQEDSLLANIFEQIADLFTTKEEEESAGTAREQQAKEPQFSSLVPSTPVEVTTLSAPGQSQPQADDDAADDVVAEKPEMPTAGKSPVTTVSETVKSAAPESQFANTSSGAKTSQKPAQPAEETVKSLSFFEKMAKVFRPEVPGKAPRQASKAEPDVDVYRDKWSVSDVQTARVPLSRRTVKTSPTPQITRYLSGKLFAIGQSIRLGSPPSGVKATDRKTCIEKRGGALLFCVVPVDWPSSIEPYFQVGNIMYQGSKAIARYDNGAATNVHTLFPTGSYDAIIQYFTSHYGQPTKTLMRGIAPLATPRWENPTALWQSVDTDTRQISTLEVRKFDDSRGGFPDTKRGVVMLYQQWSSPIFPHISMIELMLLDRKEG